jgi:DNA-binding PadR family transcriptional regulator
MALQHALLAALLEGPASGYELAKRFDAAVANYWHTTAQQLYKELGVMQGDGLVSSTVVTQHDRPNKRVVTITDDGVAELGRFVATPSRPTSVKDDALVKVTAADVVDPEVVLATLRATLDRSRAKLDGYLSMRERMLKGRTHRQFVATARRVGPYLALDRGIRFEEENVAWCLDAIAAIEQRAKRTAKSRDREKVAP